MQEDLLAGLELLQQQRHQRAVLADPADGFASFCGSGPRRANRCSTVKIPAGGPAPALSLAQVVATEVALAARALVPEFQAAKGH
jgi:hypothetical protein